MKKLFVYGAFLLALNACKSDATTKAGDKTTPSTTTGTDKTTPSTTTPSTGESGTTGTSGGGWSNADREAFLKTCSEKAAESIGQDKAMDYCSCMGEKLEKMYPNPNDAGRMTATDMQKVAEECPQ